MIPEHLEICSLEEIGSRTGTVSEVFTNNNRNLLINALFDTGASKSVMSFNMFKKLNLGKLDSNHLPHIVGTSGESLGALGKNNLLNSKSITQSLCKHS